MLQKIRNYCINEEAIELTVTHMLFIVISVAGAVAVGIMIFNAIKKGQAAMGEDFIQGG